VRPGDYRIVAFDAGFGYAPAYDGGAKSFDETVPRSVAANAAVTVDLSLRHGVLLRGDVVDSDGQAVNGINVYALDGAGNRVAGATTADGAFSLVVPADAYKFVAIDPAGRHAVTYFEHAETLAAATWVTVNQGTTLRIVLEQARLRRRTARH